MSFRVVDNGRSDWDGVDFEKYIDKPHAIVAPNGQRFGFRHVSTLGNFGELQFGGESVLGQAVGDEFVIEDYS